MTGSVFVAEVRLISEGKVEPFAQGLQLGPGNEKTPGEFRNSLVLPQAVPPAAPVGGVPPLGDVRVPHDPEALVRPRGRLQRGRRRESQVASKDFHLARETLLVARQVQVELAKKRGEMRCPRRPLGSATTTTLQIS